MSWPNCDQVGSKDCGSVCWTVISPPLVPAGAVVAAADAPVEPVALPAGAAVFVAVVLSSPQATVSATSAEAAAKPNRSLNFPWVIVGGSLLVTITER